MKKLSVFWLCLLTILVSSCKENEQELVTVKIIPEPETMVVGQGSFEITSASTFYAPPTFKIATHFLQDYLASGAGIGLTEASESASDIVLAQDTTIAAEGYSLSISEENIKIKAADAAGAFYAVQTIRQLLPPDLERLNSMPKTSVNIPQLQITDAPKFAYRGMHLDVSRHFFPKEFVKKYISYLAMLKMNRFHWHLTDDQGWRIEIKEYPLLTEHAAYRNETLIGHYNTQPQQFDGQRYGGYYTQEDVQEIVAYAETLNVTIIPEIEMPGHAQAAVSAYPELGCTGTEVPVATKWGVFENIYCPNQKTFAFLKNTLAEVMALFPGEYIHIAGDEAPKTQWKTCSHCQQLISKHNLKDEQGLQSWFIKEIETFVNSKGKKIIGWDEILEGGLAPNATIMSWRGTEGAVEAANAGHDVILTPTSHAYFDYYQDDHPDEPLAIGGFLPLKKVFEFNPVPTELTGDARNHVLGAQGNIWTEYMTTEAQVEYMAFPRMLAMAEVVWSGPAENNEEAYPMFLSKVVQFMERLEVLGVNYANHLYDLKGAVVKENGTIFYTLRSPVSGDKISYRINGAAEKTYETHIPITTTTTLTAQVYTNGEKIGRPFSENIQFHKGLKGTITMNVSPHPAYSAGGEAALLNGISGSDTRYGDGEWLGFWGDDLEITITLNEPTTITEIGTRLYHAPGQWIHAPNGASITAKTARGSSHTNSIYKEITNSETLIPFKFKFPETGLRDVTSITLKIPNVGIIPEGQQGAGNKAWTFIDEIVIE